MSEVGLAAKASAGEMTPASATRGRQAAPPASATHAPDVRIAEPRPKGLQLAGGRLPPLRSKGAIARKALVHHDADDARHRSGGQRAASRAASSARIRAMASRYDDELWELVPEDRGPASRAARRVRARAGAGGARARPRLRRRPPDRRARRERADRRRRVAPSPSSGRAPGCRRRRLVELDPDAPLPLADACFDLVLLRRDDRARARRPALPVGGSPRAAPGRTARAHHAREPRRWRVPSDPLSPHLRRFTRRLARARARRAGLRRRARCAAAAGRCWRGRTAASSRGSAAARASAARARAPWPRGTAGARSGRERVEVERALDSLGGLGRAVERAELEGGEPVPVSGDRPGTSARPPRACRGRRASTGPPGSRRPLVTSSGSALSGLASRASSVFAISAASSWLCVEQA